MLLAMDKQSVRTVSRNGHLHVATSHITKANVCPYRGAEIPKFEELGLEPDRVYQLLRHPDELAKAAPSFNGLPILLRHIPVTSAEHPREFVIGTTGTDATWNAPYLDNSMSIWDDEAIAGIESDQQRELSSAYWYDAEMSPGEFGGLRYDGIMRNIVGNHVALVPEGRAGADVIVGDSKLETPAMALKSRKALMIAGAVRAYLVPKLAQDAKVDVNGLMTGVTAKNFKSTKAKLATSITAAVKGKLAQDASLDDVVEMLDALEDVTDGEVDDDMITEAVADPAPVDDPDDEAAAVDADGDKLSKVMEFLKGKLSDDDMAAVMELVGGAADDPEPAQDFGGKVEKPGMDAKMVRKTVADTVNALRKAERDVKPLVGEVALGMDSADAIYKFALDAEKIDVTGVHVSAYPALVAQAVRAKAAAGKPSSRMALDAAAEGGGVRDMFPGARAPKRMA